MAWLSRVNFIASDTLSFSDINNLGNDIRSWGGNVNGGGYVLSNVVLSASAGTMATVTGGTGAASTLTIQSTSGAGSSDAIVFKTASQSERMRIDTLGRVGIGTTSPTVKLQVAGASGTAVIRINSTDTSPADLQFTTTQGSANIGMGVVSGTGFTNNLQFNAAGFHFITGNVGIGTASPGGKLDVVGGRSFFAAASEPYGVGARFISTGGSVYFGATNGTATPDAQISNAGGGALMTLQNGGNVGIGTTGPGSKLQVSTDSASYSEPSAPFTIRGVTDSNKILALGFHTTDNVGWIQSMQYGTAAKPLALQPLGGNVGIGTTSPQYKLHVVGNIALGLPQSGDTSASASGGQILFGDSLNAAYGNRVRCHDNGSYVSLHFDNKVGGTWFDSVIFRGDGNVGIGTATPAYKLEISTDSAGKPGVGGLWTVVSDERIKTDIIPADLDRCYEIVKSVPLKHFGFAPGVYTDDQIQDKHSLGWIAQDVQKVFSKAVSVKPFTLNTEIPDGTEEYTEQDFTLETVEKTETSIEVIDGKPVQVSKVVTSKNKVLLFDTVDVVDEAGAVVIDGDKPLTYQMPRMVTKTRNKVRHDVIEDCLDLNGGQMIAALYGAVQSLMLRVESVKAGN